MKKSTLINLVCIVCISLATSAFGLGQEKVNWLDTYTNEIITSSYTYKYNFLTVDNNPCKIKIEESKTDKKSATTTKSYILYLSDLEPSTFSFKPSGSIINVTLGTRSAQKFICAYTDNTLDEYANTITICLDAVDKSRSFIDAIKSHCTECKSSNLSWASRDEAFAWLNSNVGESSNSGSLIKQSFVKGEKSYLATFSMEKTDSKGTTQVINSFDLSDIDPKGIALKVTGKILKIEIPMKGDEYYIQAITNAQSKAYVKEIELYTDDIEIARNQVNALNYLVTNTQAVRKDWQQYSLALGFVRDNLIEATVGTNKISQTMNFDESASGIVTLKMTETDAKGVQTEEINSLYLNDLASVVKLEATSKNAFIILETKDKNKFIKQTRENKILGYESTIKLYIDDIDKGRDLIGAFEYAIKKSTSGVQEFGSLQKATDWLTKNQFDVTIDAKSYHQTIQINPEQENQIDLNIITTDATGAGVNERFEIYPEDLAFEEMKTKVSGKKLYIPISTGKYKYIKSFQGETQQNYVSDAEILFDDVQQAKNFTAALKYIHEKSVVSDRSMKDNAAAFAFLQEHIHAIEIAGINREQKIAPQESDNCKLKYVLTQTDSKGVSTEYGYDFMMTDIDPLKSLLTVSGKDIQISLLIKEKQKLIKPYKNGVAGTFIYSVDIISDDVLIAKKILAAFVSLSKGCK